MPAYHLVCTADQAHFETPSGYLDWSRGFRRWSVVNRASGSVHQEFNVCELESDGYINAHIHTFEESIYVLQGLLTFETGEGSFMLEQGNYGIVPTAAPHSVRNSGSVPARWVENLVPQPRVGRDADTYPVAPLAASSTPLSVDARDPRTRSFGKITPANMDPTQQSQKLLAVSASMRTALLVYSGISLKMMVDSDLGAQGSYMFMVQYEPGGLASPHDHPLEEVYLIEAGEVDAVFDGIAYTLKPGDIAWAGVGCIHSFKNNAPGIVRWLETQAPQLPRRYAYRFQRDWDYLEQVLDKGNASS